VKRFALFFAIILLAVGVAVAQDTDILHVDASESLGTISPYVYGSNMNLYSIIPLSLVDEAQALNLGFMRYGGGDTDRMDMRPSIIDLFVFQMRQIGAEPSMSVRLLGGTPEAAAELVRYSNIEKDYDIRYWSIGNEPNLFVALMGVDTYTAEDLSREWRAIAEAMLEVDPDIMLIGPDITQYVITNAEDLENLQYLPPNDGGAPLDAQGNDWLREFLITNGDILDYVAIHRYPYPGLSEDGQGGATIEGLRQNSAEWDVIIPNLRTVIREWAGHDIPIAVTEINSNSANSIGGEASLDSFYNAIWLGDVLGRMITHNVEIVAYWDMQGGAGRGWGILGSLDVRPTYYTYLMYTHFGTERLASESDDPDVQIYAAEREDGALTLLVINLGPDEQTKTLSLAGFADSAEAEVWLFDAGHSAEQVDSIQISDGAEITIPGQSMTMYVIPR
jgi:hypothetical protein